jgi:hypothetical protein
MPDYLLYWKDFWRDVKQNPGSINYSWHTARKSFFDFVQPGESLWVVVSTPPGQPARWRLVEQILVQRKHVLRGVDRQFQILGDANTSKRFDIDSQPDQTKLLQKLKFVSGKRISVTGRAIGKRLQAIRRLTPDDVKLIQDLCQRLRGYDGDFPFSPSLDRAIKAGAGFGDPETNKKVELAAVSYVRKHYRTSGWKVKSVESEKRGYDLLCTNDVTEAHVEVKGVQGEQCSFIITARELDAAKNDPNFILCIVRSALVNPSLSKYLGAEFIEHFDLKSLAYRADLCT